MTDKPDETPTPDDQAASVDPDAARDPEAGLVEESDELDLSDPTDEVDDTGSSDDTDDTDVSDDQVDLDSELDADDEPEPDAGPDIEDESELEPDDGPEHVDQDEPEPVVVPAHAVSDDWDETPPAEPPGPGDGESAGGSRHWGRYLVLGSLVVVGCLYAAGYYLTGTRLPAQATIGGVDVGGKSAADARTAVAEGLSPDADRDIILVRGKREFPVTPSDAGLALDVERSVAQAGGERSWDPRDMVGLFFGAHDHAPALDVDEAALDSAIDAIGEAVNKDVVEARISFPDGKPKAREPKAGRVVAKADAAEAIKAAYLVDDDPIDVPVADVEPTVDSDALAEAMTSLAEPAVSGPVTLSVGDKKVDLPVSAYAPALSIRVVDGALAPSLDPEKLAGPLTDSTTGIGKKAVDATIRIERNKPVVVPGKPGIGLQPEEMATALVPALTKTGAERVVEVEAKAVDPLFTTEDAEALKITEKIGEFSTNYPHADYRNINQSRGAELIDGVIVKPGETFSFNDTVGERTEANGFTTGTVINGGVFREELGGGVSQVVTTTYNAAFFGGMVDVEHHPHAFYIDRYPVGREATVYFGSLDLRFKNPTDYGVLIRAYVDKSTPGTQGTTTVELWSTKVWDKIEAGASERRNGRSPGTQYDDTDRCVAQSPIAGFDIDIYRTFFKDGKKARTETTTANYQAADRVICGKEPKDDD